MKWKIIGAGFLLLIVLMAISIYVFNDDLMKLLQNILYWIIITIALGLFVFIAVKIFPALKHILKL
jgi:hypothetical protein